MLKKIGGSLLSFALGAGVGSWLILSAYADKDQPGPLRSGVLTWNEARSHTDKWGEMRTYFTGETFGTTDMFTAVAVVKPGESVHPAHRHAEEEYLVIAEGSGRWHLEGKDFPAQKGDVQYIAPWVWHGLVNTGQEPLTFFVVKWNGKGVKPPPAPPGDHGR